MYKVGETLQARHTVEPNNTVTEMHSYLIKLTNTAVHYEILKNTRYDFKFNVPTSCHIQKRVFFGIDMLRSKSNYLLPHRATFDFNLIV